MTPAQLIAEVHALKGQLYLDGEDLRLQAPGGHIPAELHQQIRHAKAEIITFLKLARVSDLAALPTIEPADRKKPLRASFSQQRIWFLCELESDSSTFNMSYSLRLTGNLNCEALQAAMDTLTKRHESLRTRFEDFADGAVQVIEDDVAVPINYEVDIDATSSGIDAWLSRHAATSFDLRTAPLIRLHILKTQDQEHYLSIVIHHIIADAWSMAILLRELSACYAAHCNSETISLPDLSIQYADFSEWQDKLFQDGESNTQLQYWLKKLDDAPPLLELPTDQARSADPDYSGALHIRRLSSDLRGRLKELGSNLDASLFMVLQSAYAILLSRYAQTEDVVVGMPVAGRRQKETEGVIGAFLNTLILRTDLSGNPRFVDLLESVRSDTLEGFENQDLPFEKLVEALQPERNLSFNPVFQVLFNLRTQNTGRLDLQGLQTEFHPTGRRTAMVDLSLTVDDRPDGITLEFEYRSDLFDEPGIQRMAEQFSCLLEGIADNPLARISSLPLMSDPQRQQVLYDWNNTDFAFPESENLVSLFEKRAKQNPDDTALLSEGGPLSYKQLNSNSNRLAQQIIDCGVVTGDRVGICIDRTPDMIVAILAVLKSRCCLCTARPWVPGRPAPDYSHGYRSGSANNKKSLSTFVSVG